MTRGVGIQPPNELRSEVASGERGDEHWNSHLPIDRAARTEDDNGDGIDGGAADEPETVGGVDVLAGRREIESEHQDTHASSEVASVKGDDKLAAQ